MSFDFSALRSEYLSGVFLLPFQRTGVYLPVSLMLLNAIEHRSVTETKHCQRIGGLVSLLFAVAVEHKSYRFLLDSKCNSCSCNCMTCGLFPALVSASYLHDCGKIKVPDAILQKQGELTNMEFAIVKEHALAGEQMVNAFFPKDFSPFARFSREICRSHHERWAGGGYPDGLRGEQIPLSARIVSIADVFDALVSERPYKQAVSFRAAFSCIDKAKGVQFDPLLSDMFLTLESEIVALYKEV